MHKGPFQHHFCTKSENLVFKFATSECSCYPKNDGWADKSILALLSAYQECLVTFKSMRSRVIQRPRPLTTRMFVVGTQMSFSSAIIVPVLKCPDLLKTGSSDIAIRGFSLAQPLCYMLYKYVKRSAREFFFGTCLFLFQSDQFSIFWGHF